MPERDRIAAAIEPVLATIDLELFDVELSGSSRARTVRVIVDRDGGVDLDTITAASERISPVLDAEAGLTGAYALEVSSPGLERPLRRPEHFRRAVGETISVKLRDAAGDVRRVRGRLHAADHDGITLETSDAPEHVGYDQITQARTVFEWGAALESAKRARKKEVAR